MLRAVILDCGGVMMYPARGHWLIPMDLEEILGGPIPKFDPEAVRKAHAQCEHWISEDQLVTGLNRETTLRMHYTREMAQKLNYPLTEAQIRAIAVSLTRNPARSAIYDDVREAVYRLARHWSVGILSNAMPSILLPLMQSGIAGATDSIVISTLYGRQKPDERLYLQSLKDMNVQAEDAVFVDDLEANLLAAENVGLRAVRMIRPFYCTQPPAPFTTWEGPCVHDFSELEAWLEANERSCKQEKCSL